MLVEFIMTLILLLSFTPILLQSFYFYAGYLKRGSVDDASIKPPRYPRVSILIPVRGEEGAIVSRLLRSIIRCGYPLDRLEVIIVSDDPPEAFEKFKKEVIRGIGDFKMLKLEMVNRSVHSGYKAGALNYGLKFSNGEYVVVLDSDSEIPKDFIGALLKPIIQKEAIASTSWWYSGDGRPTLVSEGLKVAQNFLFKTLFAGRFRLLGNVALVGSGCAMPRELLIREKWGESFILEDVELGLRLSIKNYRLWFVEEPKLKLEVPKTYYALKVQQVRWSNGAGEILRRYIGELLTSKISLAKRVDNIIYLLQYSSPLAHLIFNLIGLILVLLGVGYGVFSIALYSFLVLTVLYGYSYVYSAVEDGYDVVRAVRLLGRISAITSSLTLDLAYSYLKGILGAKVSWKVTPKTERVKTKMGFLKGEMATLTIYLVGFLTAISVGWVHASTWYLINMLPLIYTFTLTIRGLI